MGHAKQDRTCRLETAAICAAGNLKFVKAKRLAVWCRKGRDDLRAQALIGNVGSRKFGCLSYADQF